MDAHELKKLYDDPEKKVIAKLVFERQPCTECEDGICQTCEGKKSIFHLCNCDLCEFDEDTIRCPSCEGDGACQRCGGNASGILLNTIEVCGRARINMATQRDEVEIIRSMIAERNLSTNGRYPPHLTRTPPNLL